LTQVVAATDSFFSDKTLSGWQKFKMMFAGMVGDISTVTDIAVKGAIDAVEEEANALGPSRAGFEDFLGQIDEINATNKEAVEAASEAAEAFKEQAAAVKKAAEEMRKLQDASMKRVTGGINPITTDELIGGGGISDSNTKILEAMQTVGGSRISGMQLPIDDFKELDLAMRDSMNGMTTWAMTAKENADSVSGAFNELGSSIGVALGEFARGEASFGEIAKKLLGEVVKIIAGYLSESVAASFAGGASTGGPAAPFTGAAAAATALALFGSLVPALLASGGVVPSGFPGDTYPAMLSSGETVLPSPHKLQGMFSNSMTLQGEFKIKGSDLVYVVNKETSKLTRYR
jgi:hypothetical protein